MWVKTLWMSCSLSFLGIQHQGPRISSSKEESVMHVAAWYLYRARTAGTRDYLLRIDFEGMEDTLI